MAHLHGCWADTPVRPGDAVNLLAEAYSAEGGRHAVVDDDSGLLILHPDVLLSGAPPVPSAACHLRCIRWVLGFRVLNL